MAVVTGHPAIWSKGFAQARMVDDTEALDLTVQSLDLIVHAMALHWADDPVGQMVQCARALRPDGLFIAVCPAGRSLQELRAALAEAEVEVTGGLSPRVLPMGDLRDLGGLIGRAGLALPVADAMTQTASYRDLFHLGKDLRAMGETNALYGRSRQMTPHQVMLRAAELYTESHPDPADSTRIRATFELVFLTGWAPSDNQPKPLRPGSAKMPLAEALSQIRKTR